MGDRVLFQAWQGQEFGPVIYGHWSGDQAPHICHRLAIRMKDRPGDVSYTSARIVQEMIGTDPGALSFGTWNADAKLTATDSHGDAGIVLVECHPEGLRFSCVGGYLKIGPGGFPALL